MTDQTITFRPVTGDDIVILRQWMNQPHWRQWWGDPETELGYIQDMLAGRDSTQPFMFQHNGEVSGYIQFWIVADNIYSPWIDEAPWMTMLPKEAIGVDISIGDEKHLSKGLGSAVLKKFTLQLYRNGHQTIIIDPDANNKRAIRAYEKAGFHVIEKLKGRTGDTLLMQFVPES